MTAERDIFREIEDEIRGAHEANRRTLRATLLGALVVILLSVVVVGGLMLFQDVDPVSAVSVLINGTETPTPTATFTPTPPPTAAPTEMPTLEVIEEATATDQPEPEATAEPTEPPTPTFTPTRAWSAEARQPFPTNRLMTAVTLSQIDAQTLIALSGLMGYSDDASYSELNFVRAQSRSFVDDTLVNGEMLMRGALPNNPLFLFVGQMNGPADFVADSGTLMLKLPWTTTPLRVQLSAPLLRQVANGSLVLNSWQVEGGWLWILATAPDIERALINCRNSAPSVNDFPMPVGSWRCDDLSNLFTGNEVAINASVVMGIPTDGSELTPLLPQPVSPIEGRWLYADFGRYGVQLALPGDVSAIIQENGIDYGLLRTNWANGQFDPLMILEPSFEQDTTLYRYLWKTTVIEEP